MVFKNQHPGYKWYSRIDPFYLVEINVKHKNSDNHQRVLSLMFTLKLTQFLT